MHDNYIKAPTVLRALMREKKRERKKRVGWSCTWIGTVHGSRPGCRDKTDLQLCFIFSLFSRLFVFGTLVFFGLCHADKNNYDLQRIYL